ncbi:MAG: aryldialkylphosphatase [Candidatus Rokubacteria bacterium]|nr:aryldialkylphosphatase [Candidatus Rokubacteria bacterium]
MARSPLAGKAQTVLGPVPAEELGITLPHEHLLIDFRFMYREPEGAGGRGRGLEPVGLRNHYEVLYDWTRSLDNLQLLDEATAIEEALLYRWEGGRTLVDPTNVGLARDPLALQRIARATGLHVIMGAGYYVGPAHPADMDTKGEDAITREIVRDLTEGVGDTGVRAGLIGEIGCSWPWTPNEKKSVRAAAEAAKQTGAPLMIHPGRNPAAPEAHLEEVRKTGLDLRRVIMCHIDRTISDAARLKAIAETGCSLEYDLFGLEVSFYPMGDFEIPSDAERLRQILWLVEQGHGRQVLMAHDICFKVRLVRYGGHGYAHILRHIVPRLRKKGLAEKDVWMLIAENPTRAVTFA